MRRWIFAAAIASAVACSSKKQPDPGAQTDPGAAGEQTAAPSGKASGVQTYTIAGDGSDTVKIQVAIPANWTVDTSDPETPTFQIKGAQVRQLAFAALTSLRGDAAERMATAIKLQFGDGDGAERQDLPDGRVWMSGTKGTNLHARMFVPYEGGVLMGLALLGKDSGDKLPEIRSVFETIKIVP